MSTIRRWNKAGCVRSVALQLHHDQRGLGSLEFLCVAALIVMASIGAWRYLGDRISYGANSMARTIEAVVTDSAGNPVDRKRAREQIVALVVADWHVTFEAPANGGMQTLAQNSPLQKNDTTENPYGLSAVNSLDMTTKAVGQLDLAGRIKGAGGLATSQSSEQTQQNLPTGEPLGGERTKRDEGKGTKVGPEYFDREKQLKDLLDPRAELNGAETTMGQNAFGGKDGQKLIDGLPTTVNSGSGKNHSSRQENASEGGDSGAHSGVGVNAKGEGSFTEVTPGFSIRKDKEGGYTTILQIGDNATYASYDKDKNLVHRDTVDVTSGKVTRHEVRPLKEKTTPNPETDTGDSHNPTGGILGAVEKTTKPVWEQAAERKRQITLPGEGPAQPDQVYMSPEDNFEMGMKKRTENLINPGDSTASTPTGTFTPEDLDRPGSGIDQVDGLRPGIRPGTPPDSPTFNQNPAGGLVPNTSADKNTGGTTEDTRNP